MLTVDDAGSWHLEARLTSDDGLTTLTFVQHLEPDADVPSVAAGWEDYLDALVASRNGAPRPQFEDYWPGMRTYYEGLTG